MNVAEIAENGFKHLQKRLSNGNVEIPNDLLLFENTEVYKLSIFHGISIKKKKKKSHSVRPWSRKIQRHKHSLPNLSGDYYAKSTTISKY